MDGNGKSQMKRLRKGTQNVISQRKGRQKGRRRQTDRGNGGGALGRVLTVGGSCTVSVLVGNCLCRLAAVSGPECQPSLNGVHSPSLSHCSPATSTKVHKPRYTQLGHVKKETHTHSQNLTISVFGYTNLKKRGNKHTHTHKLDD